jgi:hypothetical protein
VSFELDQHDVAAGTAAAGPTFPHTSSGHARAPIAIEARTAATGRSKNGSRLPSDLIGDVRKACSPA